MKIENLRKIIQAYKENFEAVNQLELFKWQAVKHFQESWNLLQEFNIMLEEALSRTYNLQDSGQYFPKRMITKCANDNPEYIKDQFINLFNQELDLKERIESFKSNIEKYVNENYNGKKSYQDDRAVSVYLSLKYPNQHYFYKYGIFKDVAEIIEFPSPPIKGRIENLFNYYELCDLIKSEIKEDQELIKLHKQRITEDCFFDNSLNILIQDIIYATSFHLGNKFDISEIIETEEIIETHIDETINYLSLKNRINLTPRKVDFNQQQKRKSEIGKLGELFVLSEEKNKLEKLGKNKLARKVEQISTTKGDGAGFDIKSFDENGNEIYIEVKTTTGRKLSRFYLTRNELQLSISEPSKFRLYRVFDFNETTLKGKLLILKGSLQHLVNDPMLYSIKLKEASN